MQCARFLDWKHHKSTQAFNLSYLGKPHAPDMTFMPAACDMSTNRQTYCIRPRKSSNSVMLFITRRQKKIHFYIKQMLSNNLWTHTTFLAINLNRTQK